MSLLAFDLSTQSCTCLCLSLLDFSLQHRSEVIYDRSFPHYRTRAGAIHADGRVYSDPRMWLDALDAAVSELAQQGADLGAVRAVCGAAQQHGTVYLNSRFPAQVVAGSATSLAERYADSLASYQSPIWMDSSTARECAEITGSLTEAVETITGSELFERFPAPQIRKIWKTRPNVYEDSTFILQISSFASAVFANTAEKFCIDQSEASASGLMDIRERRWSREIAAATAPGLLEKLPIIEESGTSLGPINQFFISKYGFSPSCEAILWSGDNPCSALSLGLSAVRAGISLGSSDTLFLCTSRFPPNFRTVFLSVTGDFLPIVVVKNGASARTSVKSQCGEIAWEQFDRLAADPAPGLTLFFSLPEITPRLPFPIYKETDVGESPAGKCRALLESQAINLYLAAEELCASITEIAVTGGAADCRSMLQIISDVFQANVYADAVRENAATGAAVIAYYGIAKRRNWDDAIRRFTADRLLVASPNYNMTAYYQRKIAEFRLLLQSSGRVSI